MEDLNIEGVFICGGTSRLPGIDQYLSDVLKLNVAYLNVSDFHFSHFERSDAHRHVIPAALSLALKGVAAGGSSSINFRQGEFAFKGDVEELGGNIKRIVISVLVLVFLALINFGVSYYYLKGKVNSINSQVTALMEQSLPNTPKRSMKTPGAALSYLKLQEKDANEKAEKLKEGVGISPLDILRQISLAVPKRKEVTIDVDSLNIKQGRVALSGRTDSFESVDRIKVALEASPLFHNVRSGNVRKGVRGEIKFDLNMNVGEVEKKKTKKTKRTKKK
ncbi:MAG: hypothetical protein ABIE74_03755 [Pseudomonadota bacterium]